MSVFLVTEGSPQWAGISLLDGVRMHELPDLLQHVLGHFTAAIAFGPAQGAAHCQHHGIVAVVTAVAKSAAQLWVLG